MIRPASQDQTQMSSSLLLTRRFAPLFWTQFFAAFSDNFLKQALIFLILFKIGGSAAGVLVQLAPAIFIAPYFFLSAFGGEMADRFDKALVAQRIKFYEIGVSILAVFGFWLHTIGYDTAALIILFLALFSFGVFGALFGPIIGFKYQMSGFQIVVTNLPSGAYTIVVFAHSTRSNSFSNAQAVSVTVQEAPALIAIDRPAAGVIQGPFFHVGGWAVDTGAAIGPGVDPAAQR